MKKILALLTAVFIAAGTLPFTIGAEGEEAASIISTSKFDNPNKYFCEGSISETDPRFNLGYSTFVPTKIGNNLPKSNIVKSDMSNYLFTATEKENGNSSEAVVSFYIRCSIPSKLQARFYHYASSTSQNATSYVPFTITAENSGKWVNITIPLNDFTVNTSSKDKKMSQFVISNLNDNTITGKVFDITPAVIYSNSGYTKYADPVSIEMQETLSLNMYEKAALLSTLTAPDGYSLADETVTYTSDNELVAAVDNDGAVFACGAGSAVITAEAANGLTAECRVTVAKTGGFNTIGSYTLAETAQSDDTFGEVYEIAGKIGNDKHIKLFNNGKNDSGHLNLKDYIGVKEAISSQAMVAFYIKATETVNLKACFFKTKTTVNSTNSVEISVTDKWQLIKIPLSKFTLKDEAEPVFSRFDIISSAAFADDMKIYISAVKVYSADPYCAVISDNAELTPELPYYTEGQTVRFSAVPGSDRIPNIESFRLETSEGALESAVTPVENSELFSFVMPSGAVRISADFTDKSVRNIAAYMLYGTTESGRTTLVSRVYIPLEAQSVLYGGSEYTVSDIGLVVVPRDLLFADETPEDSEFKKEISVLDGGDIRGYERTGGADCTVIINNVKNEREYVCRTYIRLKSETGEKTVYGNIFVK